MGVFFAGLALILAAAGAAVAFRRKPWSDRAFRYLVFAGCALAGSQSVRPLVRGSASSVILRSWVPGGSWHFGLDGLSAAFLLVVFGVGAASIAFGVQYLARERETRPVWFAHATCAVLLVALALVATAQAIVPFLCAWEVMTVASYFLIVFEDERADVRRSGLIYLVTTHAGTVALFAMFASWGVQATDWSFSSLAEASARLPNHGALVLGLAVLGFGFKAGIVPFHFWLPPAHSAAPTHVSALLSGVVIKAGIYGILRVLLLVGGAPAWWGWGVLMLGVVSGVLGVLWALAQHDIKRLLAYHSVENIGIILIGIGVGALGTRYGHPAVAIVGYAGAALHTINHALFKSVLFLGAGAVYRATSIRDMDELGGLWRALPLTWIAFFIGATAIVGLPPLNGFVSEWLVYQSMLRAAQSPESLRLAAFGVPALALIGALALACFAKAAGVVFLGTPRTDSARNAEEGPLRPLLAPMLALAGACVALGCLAPLGVGPALAVGGLVAHAPAAALREAQGLLTDAARIGILAVGVFGLVGLGWLLRVLFAPRFPTRSAETWSCGFVGTTPRMQYTASSFAAPLLSAFGRASGVRRQRSPDALSTQPIDLVLDGLAVPLWARVRRAALQLRALQQGRLVAYLIYVMAALLALLAYLALEGRG